MANPVRGFLLAARGEGFWTEEKQEAADLGADGIVRDLGYATLGLLLELHKREGSEINLSNLPPEIRGVVRAAKDVMSNLATYYHGAAAPRVLGLAYESAYEYHKLRHILN